MSVLEDIARYLKTSRDLLRLTASSVQSSGQDVKRSWEGSAADAWMTRASDAYSGIRKGAEACNTQALAMKSYVDDVKALQERQTRLENQRQRAVDKLAGTPIIMSPPLFGKIGGVQRIFCGMRTSAYAALDPAEQAKIDLLAAEVESAFNATIADWQQLITDRTRYDTKLITALHNATPGWDTQHRAYTAIGITDPSKMTSKNMAGVLVARLRRDPGSVDLAMLRSGLQTFAGDRGVLAEFYTALGGQGTLGLLSRTDVIGDANVRAMIRSTFATYSRTLDQQQATALVTNLFSNTDPSYQGEAIAYLFDGTAVKGTDTYLSPEVALAAATYIDTTRQADGRLTALGGGASALRICDRVLHTIAHYPAQATTWLAAGGFNSDGPTTGSAIERCKGWFYDIDWSKTANSYAGVSELLAATQTESVRGHLNAETRTPSNPAGWSLATQILSWGGAYLTNNPGFPRHVSTGASVAIARMVQRDYPQLALTHALGIETGQGTSRAAPRGRAPGAVGFPFAESTRLLAPRLNAGEIERLIAAGQQTAAGRTHLQAGYNTYDAWLRYEAVRSGLPRAGAGQVYGRQMADAYTMVTLPKDYDLLGKARREDDGVAYTAMITSTLATTAVSLGAGLAALPATPLAAAAVSGIVDSGLSFGGSAVASTYTDTHATAVKDASSRIVNDMRPGDAGFTAILVHEADIAGVTLPAFPTQTATMTTAQLTAAREAWYVKSLDLLDAQHAKTAPTGNPPSQDFENVKKTRAHTIEALDRT